ncbi:hypothetical protein Tcan_14508 [Toxocara canis]|uniref:Uncharacterized protein n=1 Tax=Toxocara canis TaxID=6265 RepID=A0A0B2V2W7_TOXCA|nr:hypothetical protein Tcan_14508 [Toxocara canis]
MKKDVQLQAVAERLDRVHKQMQNQMNSLSPRSRRIMTQIIESVLTFNQGRFFISMVSFKELSSDDKKQIYGLFPWMRKIRQFFAWGELLIVASLGAHWLKVIVLLSTRLEESFQMKKDVQLQAVAERLDRVHKQMQNQMNSLSPRSRRIMTQIIESVLTFNQGRFFISMVSFKELSSNDKKQIYGLFPWMRKIRQFFAWGAYYPEKFPLFVEKTNISGLPFKTAWAAEWAEPSWHQIVDEVSKSDKILGQRLYYFHQALCAKLARVTAQGFARPVMYEIIDNLIVAKKDRWLSAIDVFDHMTAFGADSMTGFKQLNRTFPWLNRHYTLMQFGAQELLGWNDEEDMRRTLHRYSRKNEAFCGNVGRPIVAKENTVFWLASPQKEI